jgi:DNA-binding SARP family transcriptional activator
MLYSIESSSMTRGAGFTMRQVTAKEEAVVQVRLLGAFAVSTSRGAVPDALWRGTRARSLFKYLAYRAGTPISRDSLLDTLWPDLEPEVSQNTLHKAVHLLRQTISIALGCDGKELLEFNDGCYVMRASSLQVDALQFKRSLFEAKWCERLNDASGALDHYEEVVALYRGDLLEDDYLVEWAIPERERLRGDYCAVLRKLAALHRESDAERSAFYLRRLLSTDPCAEDAYRMLIEMALQAGRRGEALRLYRQYKDHVWRELALPPSRELDALIGNL